MQILYQEDEGVVVFEVESAAPSDDWKPEKQLAGHTGNGYYTWRGADRFNEPGSGVLSYSFLVTRDGEFRLAIRSRHDHHDSTLQNDCFTSMDGGHWIKTFSSRRGEWTWHTLHELDENDKPPAQYRLSAGIHTLRLSGRSNGFSIDRIHLYREGAAGAEDESLKETTGLPEIPQLRHATRIVTAWRAGRPGDAIRVAEQLRESADRDVADEALRSVETLTAYARQQQATIEQLGEDEPVLAADLYALLAKRFQGSSLGREFAAEARKIAADPVVVKERKARVIYEVIHKVAAPLLGRGKITNRRFAEQHLRELSYIANGWNKLEKAYADTKSYEKARQLVKQLGAQVE